jgi:hypothetical protein
LSLINDTNGWFTSCFLEMSKKCWPRFRVRNSTYVHCPLLKTPLRKEDSVMNLLCSEVKTIFALKFNSVTVVWRLLAELSKIRKI